MHYASVSPSLSLSALYLPQLAIALHRNDDQGIAQDSGKDN